MPRLSSSSEGGNGGIGPIGRAAAIGALVVAVLAVTIVLLTSGDEYTVTAKFENASQVVGGEQVTVAGTPVGSVEEVSLGDQQSALVTFTVSDEHAPLPGGTTARIAPVSLAGVANRQVQLTLPSGDQAGEEIPDDGTIGLVDTQAAVDLDQLFNTLDDRTVRNLKKVIRGLADAYDGVGPQANRGFKYLNPFLFASRRLFGELTRDEGSLERMLVDTSQLSGALASRRDDVSALVHNLNLMMGAIGSRKESLSAAVGELPDFMRSFNTTAVNLRATLDDVDPLVDAAKPVALRLRPFFRELRGASSRLVPTVRDLDQVVRRGGRDNDLVEFTRLQVPLSRIALGPVHRDGTERGPDRPARPGAFPETERALRDSLPQLSFLRAYTPELVGWFDDFSHSGIYDANGGIGRINTTFNSFSAATPGVPSLFQPPIDPSTVFGSLLDTGNTRRCPGANERNPGDGSTPFTDGGRLDCDPNQIPVGPEMRRSAPPIRRPAPAAAGGAAAEAGGDGRTYTIELDNAFGIVEGSEVRVAGVTQGEVTGLDINAAKRAVVTAELTGPLSQLGDETVCSSEPQSLIGEYFLDCDPQGDPLESGGSVADPDIPVEQTRQTVQADLAQNTFRQPFNQRLRILINEFGTALAGNGDNLNAAIERGAPALRDLHATLRILGGQNRIIRGLISDADRILVRLAARRADVARFIREARDTAVASAERRGDLSRDFELLDDFLAELRPTIVRLGGLAREQTPLLADLRASAPGLNRLALQLPDFADSARTSLTTLGDATVVGTRALRNGRDEIRALRRASRNAPATATSLADLLRDLDDPRRAVEIDRRAGEDTGRTGTRPGRRDTMGYTGLEGLLNYAYYQTGALNQFDQVSHMLHFSLYEVGSGACGEPSTGGRPGDPEFGVPAAAGGHTTDIRAADPCVSWLGGEQPRLSEPFDLPPYDPSVCDEGSDAPELCTPAESAAGVTPAESAARAGGDEG